MYRKFNIEYFLARNMFIMLNMDNLTPGVSEKNQTFEDPLARNMFIRSKMDYCMANVTSEVVNENV